MSEDIVIRVENLSKAYGLPPLWGKADTRERALKDIHFEIKRGELLGLIGRNGAGKSTLLKMLAGVSPPSRGSVSVTGRVFPMIELNAGMNPALTGRENVMLLGTIMGLSPREIKNRMPEIEAFCDLGEWFDRPVKQYSSGMPGRLGFAVAAYSDADILLIDEVLAVGDLVFRNKCMERMHALRELGKTVVFASHNMSAITGLCTRTIMLERGEIRYDSLPGMAVQHYKDFVASLSKAQAKRQMNGTEVACAPGFALHGLIVTDEEGMPLRELRSDLSSKILIDCDVPIDFAEGWMEVMIVNEDKVTCVHEKLLIRAEGPPEYRRISLSFPHGLGLRPGEYTLHIKLADLDEKQSLIALQAPLVIATRRQGKGIVTLRIKTAVSSPTLISERVPPLKMAG